MGSFFSTSHPHHRHGHLTFSFCGSSHHLGPNLSKQFTPNWCDKNHPKVQSILNNPNMFKLMHSISVKLLVAFYFWLCFAKLQQKKKQKNQHFSVTFLWFISSHGPIQLYIFTSSLRCSGCTNEATQLSSCLETGVDHKESEAIGG